MYRTVERRLSAYAEEAWRQRLPAACAAHAKLGPASLVCEVSTLKFETDQGDGFGEPRFNKERRPKPQVTGRSADRTGRVPAPVLRLSREQGRDPVDAPSHRRFRAAHKLPDVRSSRTRAWSPKRTRRQSRPPTGRPSRDEDPEVSYQVGKWRREHPGEKIPLAGHVFTQPWSAGPKGGSMSTKFPR